MLSCPACFRILEYENQPHDCEPVVWDFNRTLPEYRNGIEIWDMEHLFPERYK